MGDNAIILVSTALAAFGVVVSFDNLVDLELEDFRDGAEDEQRKFIASSEQVFVVQYRKVHSK